MTKSSISSVATSTGSPAKTSVAIRHHNKSPLRQRFIDYLILQQKARRTVEADTDSIRHLYTFHHRSPDKLGQPEIRTWLLHLITERKLSASSINLAINALRAFYGGLLGQDIEPLLVGIKRPPRRIQTPRVFSPEEIERLITVGTKGDPFARVFLMTVFGGGFRLSEAIHLQVSDIDGARLQLRVSHWVFTLPGVLHPLALEFDRSGGAERRKNLAHGVSRGISGARCASPGGATENIATIGRIILGLCRP